MVQLNKCVVLFCKAGIVVMGILSSYILFKYEYTVGHLFDLSWDRVRRVSLGSVFRNAAR